MAHEAETRRPSSRVIEQARSQRWMDPAQYNTPLEPLYVFENKVSNRSGIILKASTLKFEPETMGISKWDSGDMDREGEKKLKNQDYQA